MIIFLNFQYRLNITAQLVVTALYHPYWFYARVA